jgi:protein-disulfide isomerase
VTTPTTARLVLPIGDRDHTRGPATAPVTLIEYGDFECPFCGQAYPVVEALLEQLADEVLFAYRHFPLTQVHPHAQHAAEASEVAAAHGRFWEMHHLLFQNQRALDDRSLARYAASIGIDPADVIAALAEGTYAARVREDFLSGVRSGVNGTPSFFINDLRYDGPRDLRSMVAAVKYAAEERDR